MAPEALVCRPSPKSDVFSLAATLFHLLSGFPPFSEDQHQNLIEASAGRVRTLPTASAIPAPVQDTIRAGLLPNAEHRPELDAFKTRLADAWSQVLAQNLLRRARSLPHTVSLTVSVFRHQESQSALQLIRVFESSQDHGPTNLPEISVRTGDELLFKIAVGAKGHLAVLDFGSSGQMQVFKLKAERAGGLIQPGKSVCQALRLTGPPGIDRFAVVWSRDPMDWGADAWRRCLAGSNHLQQPPNELNRDAQMLGPPVVTTPSSALTCVAFAISHGT